MTKHEKNDDTRAMHNSSSSELSALLCCACGKPVDQPFMNGVDSSVMCETCAVAEYKSKYPLTWDMPVFNTEIFINTKAT